MIHPADKQAQTSQQFEEVRLQQELTKIGQMIAEASSVGAFSVQAPDNLTNAAAAELIKLGYRLRNHYGIKNLLTGKLYVVIIEWTRQPSKPLLD